MLFITSYCNQFYNQISSSYSNFHLVYLQMSFITFLENNENPSKVHTLYFVALILGYLLRIVLLSTFVCACVYQCQVRAEEAPVP